MSQFSFGSLRVRLILLVLLAVIPAVGLSLYSGFEQREEARQNAFREAELVATLAAENQNLLVQDTRKLLISLSIRKAFNDSQAIDHCHFILANLLEQFPEYLMLGVADVDGNVYCSAPRAEELIHISDHPWFQQALQTRSFSVGTYQTAIIDNQETLIFAHPVLNEQNQMAGAVFAGLNLDWLNQKAAMTLMPEGSSFTVIDREGTIITRYPDPEGWVGKTLSEAPIVNEILSQGGMGTAEVPGLDGILRLYAFTPVGNQPNPSLFVSIGIPTEIAFARANQALTTNLFGLGIVASLALAAAWFGGDIFILRRTKALLKAIKHLESGDLNARTGLPYGSGELSQIALAFDQMVENLQFQKAEAEQAEATARESEARYCRTLDSMMEGCQIIGFDWRYLYVNEEVARQARKTREELLGHTMMEMYPGIENTDMFAALRRCMEQRIPTVMENEFVYPDGASGWFELSIQPEPEGIFILSIDINDRKLAEQELLRVNRTLQTLSKCNQLLVKAEDENSLLQGICRSIVETVGFRLAWVGYAEHDEARSVRPVAQAGYEEGYLETLKLTWADTPRGHGPTGTAIRTGKPAIASNILTDPNFAPWREQAQKRGYASSIALPLFINGQTTLGALNIYSEDANAFGVEESKLLSELAADLSYGITALRTRTKHEQAEAKVHRQLQSLAALRAIDLAITSSLDLRVIFDVLLDKVTTQLNLDAACVLLLNPHTQILEYASGRGFRTPAPQHMHLRLGEGYAGQAALEKRIIHIPDVRNRETNILRSPFFSSEDFVSCYAVPLVAKGHVKGVMEVFKRAPLDPDQEWLDFLEALAGQAAIALDNAGLFDDLQRSNVELMSAYDTTIEGWSRALDLRDRETEGHSKRVTEMTLKLAREMGIGDAELIHARRGALLHDIGKMGIPDYILHKPGPLSEEEWGIMRKHPVYAYELLSPIAYLRPALDIPYCHHEKWDGTGYPRGLKGEQIPLAARIFAIADVWDALLSDRPYRKAWSVDKVLEYINGQIGKHFDPKVVEVFLKAVNNEVE